MSETNADPAPADAKAGLREASSATAGSGKTTTATSPRNGSDPLLGYLFFIFLGGVWFFAAVESWLYRGIAITAVVVGFAIWFVLLWGRGQGKATWDSFKRQSRLLSALALTILGAPTIAILLAHNDRMLALKLLVIVLLSFLPAALYWQFMSGKGRALWDEFVINLYRLGVDHPLSLPEPPVQSVFYALWERVNSADGKRPDPHNNLYRKKFEGVFGPLSDDESSQRALVENARPVVLATLFISLGWVLVLRPESVFLRSLFGVSIPAASVNVPLDEIGYGFLGAYFYCLQMLMRRYYQNDLKTGAYINVAMRIVIVGLLTWILSEVWKSDPAAAVAPWRYGVAFTIGVFPDVGWHLLQQLLKLPARWIDDSFRIRCPLSDIDGLNVWYQARLLEEGIEDMETLVTANLVDVMLHTRIPIERLVDWIDQSVFLLHLPDKPEEEASADAKKNTAQDARAVLAHLGIRKATELLSMYSATSGSFRVEALRPHAESPNEAFEVLVAIAEAIRREPVLYYVINWKNFPHHYLDAVRQDPQKTVGNYTPPTESAARRSLGVEPLGDVLAT